MSGWYEVTVDVPVELSELTASYLLDLGSPGLQSIDGDGVISLIAYFREPSSIAALDRLLSQLHTESGRPWSPVIRSREIDEQDWAEDWKRHFVPTPVGRSLRICPPWDASGTPGRVPIIIHPGMAFGTGQHPTTRGCLELIEEGMARGGANRALDVGTGSGILAIALTKLGVPEVCAIDNDVQACAIAEENARRNSTSSAMTVTADWEGVEGFFDLIVANLFADLLRDYADRLQGLLGPHGLLVCSGFLTPDESSVIAAYPQLTAIGRREEDSWVALMLARDGASR